MRERNWLSRIAEGIHQSLAATKASSDHEGEE